MMRIGIDLGGTKIEGIALGGSTEVARLRVPTPRGDYDATLDAVAAVVASLEGTIAHSRRSTVGVGIPGTISSAGLVKNANSTWLNGRPLQRDLEQRLARAVRLANDANCFAISEAADGAAAGAPVAFGVILGTGVGGGIVVDGKPLSGSQGIAGEWGHNPLPWPQDDDLPQPSCYCGQTGCIETYLSGPALAHDYRTATRAAARDDGRRAGEATAADVSRRANEGEAVAEATLGRYAHRLARALAGVINVLDPDVVVLGGGLSNVDRLYRIVPTLWQQWVFGAAAEGAVRTRLVRAAHGDSSGVRGAAWLWPVE